MSLSVPVKDQKDSVDTDGDAQPPRQRPKKLFHKKSRTGCGTCRSRRVKCDEVHPVCGNCERHGVECFYDRTRFRFQDQHNSEPHKAAASKSPSSASSPSSTNAAIGRSSSHLLELQLMSQFITKTVDSLPTSAQPELAKLWREDAPRLALKNPALLETIFALASLHLTLTEPSSNCFDAHCQYMDSVLKAHREDIRNVTLFNMDALWLTSSLLRVVVFSRLQGRNIKPYSLPGEWLNLTSMAGLTYQELWKSVRETPGAENLVTMPLFRNSILAQEWQRRPADVSPPAFAHLLDRIMPRDEFEPWGQEIREIYAQAVEALENIRLAINTKQPTHHVTMRLVAYLGLVRPEYSQFVLDKQPRALVIFAHYFALMADFTNIWMIGPTPQRELTGIATLVRADWQPFMHWPMSVHDSLRAASGVETINFGQFTI